MENRFDKYFHLLYNDGGIGASSGEFQEKYLYTGFQKRNGIDASRTKARWNNDSNFSYNGRYYSTSRRRI
jgi:hypothetical protein